VTRKKQKVTGGANYTKEEGGNTEKYRNKTRTYIQKITKDAKNPKWIWGSLALTCFPRVLL